MIILGIDPGASGAIGALQNFTNGEIGRRIEFAKLSNTERDISDFLSAYKGTSAFAFIEKVHSMPKQGVASSFKFGANYGFLRGCLISLGIPFEEVTPQKWQKFMGCMSRGDKNVTKARAQQLFPEIKITHAIADALLIAEYGRRVRSVQARQKRYGAIECLSLHQSRTGRMSDQRCPKCGSTLLMNDYGQVWCSFIGGGDERACSFGIEHDQDCDQRLTITAPCTCGYAEAQRDKVFG